MFWAPLKHPFKSLPFIYFFSYLLLRFFQFLPALSLHIPSPLSSSAVWNTPPCARGKDAGLPSLSSRGERSLHLVMESINTNIMVSTERWHKSDKRHVHVCWRVQYLPCDEVFEAQQFISVLWVLLSVLLGKERLMPGNIKNSFHDFSAPMCTLKAH